MPLPYKSLHGRQLGLTSTGGLAAYTGSSGQGSTALTMFWQQWGSPMVATHSSSGATLNNYGINIISSDVGAAVINVPAPVAGVEMKISIEASASAITLNTTAAAITFSNASSALTLGAGGAGSNAGTCLTLCGVGTTHWAITARSSGWS